MREKGLEGEKGSEEEEERGRESERKEQKKWRGVGREKKEIRGGKKE